MNNLIKYFALHFRVIPLGLPRGITEIFLRNRAKRLLCRDNLHIFPENPTWQAKGYYKLIY